MHSPSLPPAPPLTRRVADFWTDNGTIRTNAFGEQRGSIVQLKGISWSGLERRMCAVGGVDEVPMARAASFVKQNGFNAVRIPIAVDALLHADGRAPCM
eukprot:5469883-Prymnesium_polylepis.2